jgi:hypothetical protein
MKRRLLGPLAACAALAALAGCGGSGSGPTVVAGTSQDETLPAGGPGVAAWTVDGVDGMATPSVWVREGSRDPYRLTLPAHRTLGFTGQIDGGRLVLQVADNSESDIAIYDLRTRRYLPTGLDSASGRFRSQPVLAGSHLAFVESTDSGPVLFGANLVTGDRTTIRAARGRSRLVNGAAAGHWLAFSLWSTEGDRDSPGTLALYDFDRRTIRYVLPPAGRVIYAPAITADGTLYYVETTPTCGPLTIVRRRGDATDVVATVKGKEIGSIQVVPEGVDVALLYDAWPVEKRTCDRAGDSDVFRLLVPAATGTVAR